ncbi:MAG: ATP-dependent Clp protease ATP-binding subunit [Planctomycetes bacterium]|nr:ATP-dependent Clp protease ATP-binding subunit [Planctomycetota bacterium]
MRPLFATYPDATREELKKATDNVAAQLRKRIQQLAAEPRQEDLAQLLFAPHVTEQRVQVQLQLKRRNFAASYLFAIYESLGRRVAFAPRLPDVHFTLEPGQELAQRAAEVLGAHYRKLERDEVDFQPDWHAPRGESWIGHVSLNIEIDALARKSEKQEREAVAGYKAEAGGAELQRVGRNLCEAYPEDLQRAVLREQDVAELQRLLWSNDRRPLLLLGRPGAGKTALLHEALRRTMEAGRVTKGGARQLWLVSPQRLISGMSYVGQWENRINNILAECRRKRHILYFDDFLGLFRAGVSSSSRLSVANVLRPHAERREVRVLAEMTPEAFAVLSEQDRAWADLFHVLHVHEPPEADSWRILLQAQRELEARHGARFDMEALPAVMDLTRRYRREEAFPGKAAAFLGQLANKHRNGAVSRADVLREFEARSGLSVTFLDERAELPRAEILAGLRQRVIGQDPAVDALANAVSVAKARLNDPERPLGTFLFLGPTGTGKTQCAKALAAWLYGDESSLLRFDMNEFVDGHAVARLAGTMAEAEGLLTGAVRRRPFATILFDEIEKAHPSAFDLLLQVLGEGRLTDTLGRTADFTNCMIVLTSNLGAQQADGGLGFSGHELRGSEAYTQAARRFFRPEFFNRLDYIVPFAPLPHEQVESIARGLIRGVLSREGLSRRLCALHVEPAAMQAVVDQGYHPALGARAIKRAIENQLTRPLAEQLAALAPEMPTLLRLGAQGGQLVAGVFPLAPAAVRPGTCAALDYAKPDACVAQIDNVLNQAEQWLEDSRPTGAISGRDVSPQQRRYFAVRHAFEWLDQAVERFVVGARAQADRPAPRAEDGASARMKDRGRPPAEMEWDSVPAQTWRSARGESDLRALLAGQEIDPARHQHEDRLRFLVAAAAQLRLMLVHPPGEQRVLFTVRTLDGHSHPIAAAHAGAVQQMARRRFELEVDSLPSPQLGLYGFVARGDLAAALLQPESGTLLLWHENELALGLVQVQGLDATGDPSAAMLQAPDPTPGPVLRVWLGQRCLDVRSGTVSRTRPPLALMQVWAAGDLELGGTP